MNMVFLIVTLALLSVNSADLLEEDELLTVMQYTSEGIFYPRVDVLSYAKGRANHLTPGGMRQLYVLGRELRKRYIADKHLVDDRYLDRSKVEIKAAGTRQAVASAISLLSGIYLAGSGDFLENLDQRNNAVPPNKYDFGAWKDELESAALNYTLQSVPVSSNSGSLDTLMNPIGACPGIKNMISYNDGDHRGEQRKYETFYAKLASAFRLDNNEVTNVSFASELRASLKCSLCEGQAVLSEEETLTLIEETFDIEQANNYLFLLDINFHNRLMSQIMATPILSSFKDALSNAKDRRYNNQTLPLRWGIHVGGGPLLLAILKQLKLSTPNTLNDYSSTLLIELYKNVSSKNNDDTDFYFNIIYNKEIPKIMTYNDFLTLIKLGVYSPEEFTNYCARYNREDHEGFTFNWMIFGIVVGAVVGLILIGVLIFFLRMKCKNSTTDEEEEEAVLRQLKGQLGVKD